MRIAEIYKSRQGEGLLTGVDSVFVRTSGCNLRCWFCDTPYTSWRPEGDELELDEIVRRIDRLACDHVVVTGGEPMLFAELPTLCERLQADGRHVTIETAGTLYLPLPCDLMSISPKLSSSTPSLDLSPQWHLRHERDRLQPEVIRRLTAEHAYQMKFVVGSPADCEEVETWLLAFPEIRRDRVLLMPEGTELAKLHATAEWLAPYCDAHGLRFCPRRQIEWYGATRGT